MRPSRSQQCRRLRSDVWELAIQAAVFSLHMHCTLCVMLVRAFHSSAWCMWAGCFSKVVHAYRAGGAPNAGAPQRRKSATVTATAAEVQPARRTRSANAPSVADVSQAELVGHAPVSPDSHMGMAALLAAAAGGKSITHHAVLEQIAVLHGRPQTEETKQYLQQLQAMLQVC